MKTVAHLPSLSVRLRKSGDESRWRCLHPNFRKYKSNQEFISDFSHDYDFVYDCFWILSIGISYYLSSLSMRPIILSWKTKEFVENASHELRTPLTIIQNSLEHLLPSLIILLLKNPKASLKHCQRRGASLD